MPDSSVNAIIHRLYEECLNQGRLERLSELVNPEVVSHFGSNQVTGFDAFEQNIRQVRGMFPNGSFTVDDIVSNGDKAAARWTMTGTHTAPIAGVAPTGKPITNRAVVFYRFENGKIAEVWLQVDQVGVLRQVGVEIPGLPAPPVPSR